MKLVYSIWVWLLLLVPVESFKILVWPAEWSHWINMKVKSYGSQKDIKFHILDHYRGIASPKSYDSRDAIFSLHGLPQR